MEKIINARILVKPEHVNQFITIAKTMVEKSNSEPGCIIYKLFQEVGNPIGFIFYEKYINQEAIDSHNTSTHFKTFKSQISELVTGNSQVDIF